MHQNKSLYLFLIVLLVSGCTRYNSEQLKALTQTGYQSFYGDRFPITLHRNSEATRVKHAIQYQFVKQDQYDHYLIEIDFAVADSLLAPQAYTSARQQSRTTHNPQQHQQFFPNIGSKAQYRFLGAGPGGSAEMLVFTSSNKKWDVSIVISHLLPENVALPDRSIEQLARYLDQALQQEVTP